MNKYKRIQQIVDFMEELGIKFVNVEGIVTAQESRVDRVAVFTFLTEHGCVVITRLVADDAAEDFTTKLLWEVLYPDGVFLMHIEWVDDLEGFCLRWAEGGSEEGGENEKNFS